MAAINDLIRQITDPDLRDRIQKEVDKFAKQKKFGLVFEQHLPECTPLYDIPVHRGVKAALKAGDVSDYFQVLKVEDGKALCIKRGETEAVEYSVGDLVTIAEFGEPIYPFLKPIDTVCNLDKYCYTPDIVYDAVADYVAERFGLDRKDFVRPFYPGGDYENEKYKPTDVVVDNPPFSILAQITRFYGEHKIPYFLFAPALTCLSADDGQRCAICLNVSVIYENRANVSTSFVTNMIPGKVAVTDPALYKKVMEAADKYAETLHASLPKYNFPDEVATAARLGYLSRYGQTIAIPRNEAVKITGLDAMKEYGKGIYGGAYLISEKAAAEKAAATTWQLSEREREIVRGLA